MRGHGPLHRLQRGKVHERPRSIIGQIGADTAIEMHPVERRRGADRGVHRRRRLAVAQQADQGALGGDQLLDIGEGDLAGQVQRGVRLALDLVERRADLQQVRNQVIARIARHPQIARGLPCADRRIDPAETRGNRLDPRTELVDGHQRLGPARLEPMAIDDGQRRTRQIHALGIAAIVLGHHHPVPAETIRRGRANTMLQRELDQQRDMKVADVGAIEQGRQQRGEQLRGEQRARVLAQRQVDQIGGRLARQQCLQPALQGIARGLRGMARHRDPQQRQPCQRRPDRAIIVRSHRLHPRAKLQCAGAVLVGAHALVEQVDPLRRQIDEATGQQDIEIEQIARNHQRILILPPIRRRHRAQGVDQPRRNIERAALAIGLGAA